MMKDYVGHKKIARIYIDTQDRYKSKPLYEEILYRAKEFLSVVDEIIEEGLCVIADVEVISYKHK